MSSIGKVKVPYEGNESARILFVGESPGGTEEDEGRPFVGVSGQLLRSVIHRHGFSDDQVFFANLIQLRPVGDRFQSIVGTNELDEGLDSLYSLIDRMKPNVIGALGNWPMYYLTGTHGKGGPGSGIGRWRGSILRNSNHPGIKVVSTYHPAYIARNRSDYPIFDTDIKRILAEGNFPEFNYKERRFIIDPQEGELLEWVNKLCKADWLAIDIESVKGSTHILCIAFSPSPDISVCLPYRETNFENQAAISAILASQSKKIFHNGGAFDIPMLQLNGHEVKNYAFDTMAAQHVMWIELPKSLDFLTSIYTREPYYKTTGRAEIPSDNKSWSRKTNRTELYKYCCKDTACTFEVFEELRSELSQMPSSYGRILSFEMRSYRVAAGISATGMPVDKIRRARIKKTLMARWAVMQYILNGSCGYKLNVNSPKAVPQVLYDKDKMNLPRRKNRFGKVTADEDAIVASIAWVRKKMEKMQPGSPAYKYWIIRRNVLKLILVIRGIRKILSSYINIKLSEDDRLRSVYKITGTATGRWANSKWFDGSGCNAQTFPRDPVEIKNYDDVPELQPIIDKFMKEDSEGEDAE